MGQRNILYAVIAVQLAALSGCGEDHPGKPLPSNARRAQPRFNFAVPSTTLTVLLPSEPQSERFTATTPHGDLQIATHSAHEGTIQYTIAITDYPESFIEEIAPNRSDFLVRLADGGLKKRPGSKIILRETFSLGSLPGLEEQVEMPGGRTDELDPTIPMIAYRRSVHDGNRMYMFQILIPKADYDVAPSDFDHKAKEFLTSIQ